MSHQYKIKFKSYFTDHIEYAAFEAYASNSGLENKLFLHGHFLSKLRNDEKFTKEDARELLYSYLDSRYLNEKYSGVLSYLVECSDSNKIFNMLVGYSIEYCYLPYAAGFIAKTAMPPSIRGRTVKYFLKVEPKSNQEFNRFKIEEPEKYEAFQELFESV